MSGRGRPDDDTRTRGPSSPEEQTPAPDEGVRSSEVARIERLATCLAGPPPDGAPAAAHAAASASPASQLLAAVRVGIGDDAAVLEPGRLALVWTVDVQVEHVHFELEWLGLGALGYRATMAALSDLAAMGARPRGVLSSLVLPAHFTDSELTALAQGQRRACDALGTAVIGGNLSRGAELSVTTTAIGSAERVLLRSGARPGDRVWLAGPVGLAGAGLELLRRGAATPLPLELDAGQPPACPPLEPAGPTTLDHARHAALVAWALPIARIDAGLVAAKHASAAIDLSDGLARDGCRIVEASSAAGEPIALVLDADALVSEELRALAPSVRRGEALPRSKSGGGSVGLGAQLARPALDFALHGGEDYALLVTAPAEHALEGFVAVGRCEPRAPDAPRLWLRWPDGRRERVPAVGYDHFE